MIAYLENEATGKPTAVLSAQHRFEDAAATGRVTSTITHGDLFLHRKGHRDQSYRLRWSPEDEERARALPVGVYKVSGYRHIRTAEDGRQWIWSTSSPAFREIEVQADETTHCAVRQGLGLMTRWFEKKGKQRAALAFLAEKRLGNTLYRDGKRITIHWELLDAAGEVLADGAMRYG